MTNFETIERELQKFGLSKNQSLIYLYLVAHGELRIQEIVGITRIPRSSVYECLKGLLKQGLVEEIIEYKFTRYKAYPIGSIRHGLNEKLNELQSQITDLNDLEKAITLLPKKNTLPATTVRYYKGVSGARQLFWNTLNAKNTVYVFSAYGRSKFVGKSFYMDFVRESQIKKIKEKVLINPTERAINFIKRDTGTSLARTKLNDLKVLKEENILIQGETFIYNNIYSQINFDSEGIDGFEIESDSFTKMQRSLFETLWKVAKPIAPFLYPEEVQDDSL